MAIRQEERAGANLSFWEATAKESALHPLRENSGCEQCGQEQWLKKWPTDCDEKCRDANNENNQKGGAKICCLARCGEH